MTRPGLLPSSIRTSIPLGQDDTTALGEQKRASATRWRAAIRPRTMESNLRRLTHIKQFGHSGVHSLRGGICCLGGAMWPRARQPGCTFSGGVWCHRCSRSSACRWVCGGAMARVKPSVKSAPSGARLWWAAVAVFLLVVLLLLLPLAAPTGVAWTASCCCCGCCGPQWHRSGALWELLLLPSSTEGGSLRPSDPLLDRCRK